LTLATIVQNACAEVGVSTPSSVIGSTDANVTQMLALLNREGRWLARGYEWQVLRREGSFVTSAANLQVANLQSFTDVSAATITDLDRIVPKTIWNRTTSEQVGEPLTAQRYQGDLANVTTGIRYRYIIRGNALLFSPVPPASQNVYFEYISKSWCQSSGGTRQTAFAADTDTGILDEDMLTQGLVVRFLKAKGLDYAEEFRRYEQIISSLTGSQSPGPDLSATPPDYYDITDPHTPDGNWS
jgi:hypothetical protein